VQTGGDGGVGGPSPAGGAYFGIDGASGVTSDWRQY
jgi:hypothetical protein